MVREVAKRQRRTPLTKIYEDNVAKYRKNGHDGRAMDFDSYRRGFYNLEFNREAKKAEAAKDAKKKSTKEASNEVKRPKKKRSSRKA